MVLLNSDEKVASKKVPNSRLVCKNLTLFMTKMAQTDTLTAEKPFPWGCTLLPI